jgi:hypothetical protein
MHAFMHWIEWHKWKRQEDFIASQGLFGLISSAEAAKLALIESNKRRRGTKQSASLIAKRSASMAGKAKSLEHRKNISLALTGKKRSQDSIDKAVAKLRGQKRTAEFCANQSAYRKGRPSGLKGRKKSETARLNMSIAAFKRWKPGKRGLLHDAVQKLLYP